MEPRPALTPGEPRVAVIVPAYGVAHLLGDALASLQAQALPEWECVVIDDGAPDDVAGAVAPFLADPRFRFLATDNRGLAGARNRAIAAARAPYIALLDGDDLFRPDYLGRMAGALDADPLARFVTCNARIFGAVEQARLCVDGKQGSGDGMTGSLGDVLDRSFNVYIGSAFRRADWQAVGGFDETFTHCEDFDFWVRLLLLGGHARYVDAVLGEYRVRPGSLSGNAAKMIRGNIRVYENALARHREGSEAGIAHRMLAENHAQLAFEEAAAQVAAGDTRRGLPALRAARRGPQGPVWTFAFLLWRIIPQSAPPMMRWRRKSHSRGSSGVEVPPLGRAAA
jgi:glycosyltransferase involved in cell wall biosynthesis